MKIAIVHDNLVQRGGGERVALYFHQAFPEAPIYTLAYRKNLTYSDFKKCKIITSEFQKIAFNEQVVKKLFFPIGIMAMKRLDVTDFDVVLMSSTHCAKYVKLKKDALVINFCHCPFRLAWYPKSYGEYNRSRGVKKWIFDQLIRVLRNIDYRSAQRIDYFIANTAEMAKQIKTIYRPKKEVSVINPPVLCENFYTSTETAEYYLVVSRLEYYKKIDLAVRAFNILKRPLIVVGHGTYKKKLMKIAGNNIIFKSELNEDELASLYSRCKALIFPQIEDYGITPLEANASGKPVIAFGKGGVLETMIPHNGQDKKATSLFFYEQTVDSLVAAVLHFESLQFDLAFIRTHALQFDTSYFIEKVRSFISCRYEVLKKK